MLGGCVQSSNCKDQPGNPSASEQGRQATLGTMTNLQMPARGRTARREYRSIICVDSDLSRIRTDSPGRGTKPGQSKGSDSLKKGCWRRPMTRGSFRTEDDVARAQTAPTDKDCLPIFILTLRVTEVVEPLKLPYSQNETLSHLNAGSTSDGRKSGAASGLHTARDTPPSRAFPSRMFPSLPRGTLLWTTPHGC